MIKINERSKALLSMIYKLSSGKGYLFKDQLSVFLIEFKIYENCNAINKSILSLESHGYLRRENPGGKYIVVALSHKGGLAINIELHKRITVKPLALRAITMRVGILQTLINDYRALGFERLMSRKFCTITLPQNVAAVIKMYDVFNDGYKAKHKEIFEHLEYLNNHEINMRKNLISESKSYKRDDFEDEPVNMLTMMKKGIYTSKTAKKDITYVKILQGGNYDALKMKQDYQYVKQFHNDCFRKEGGDHYYGMKFQIATSRKAEYDQLISAIQEDENLRDIEIVTVAVSKYFEVKVSINGLLID